MIYGSTNISALNDVQIDSVLLLLKNMSDARCVSCKRYFRIDEVVGLFVETKYRCPQ